MTARTTLRGVLFVAGAVGATATAVNLVLEQGLTPLQLVAVGRSDVFQVRP
jgi:hypothetical protein